MTGSLRPHPCDPTAGFGQCEPAETEISLYRSTHPQHPSGEIRATSIIHAITPNTTTLPHLSVSRPPTGAPAGQGRAKLAAQRFLDGPSQAPVTLLSAKR